MIIGSPTMIADPASCSIQLLLLGTTFSLMAKQLSSSVAGATIKLQIHRDTNKFHTVSAKGKTQEDRNVLSLPTPSIGMRLCPET